MEGFAKAAQSENSLEENPEESPGHEQGENKKKKADSRYKVYKNVMYGVFHREVTETYSYSAGKDGKQSLLETKIMEYVIRKFCILH